MVTSLRRTEIVIGKVLPYLGLSILLIAMAVGVAYFHFGTKFQRIGVLSLICFLFLCCSLGLGLLISAFCQTQTQSIQFAVFYLLPVLMLSGAFCAAGAIAAGDPDDLADVPADAFLPCVPPGEHAECGLGFHCGGSAVHVPGGGGVLRRRGLPAAAHPGVAPRE